MEEGRGNWCERKLIVLVLRTGRGSRSVIHRRRISDWVYSARVGVRELVGTRAVLGLRVVGIRGQRR